MHSVGVIGGGLAGLTAAILLARRGMRVTLLEAQDHLGGCCATTSIDGYTFNDGALFVALPELLDHAFAQLGLDRAERLPSRPISSLQATILPGAQTVTMGWDALSGCATATGSGDEGAAREDLEKLVRRWEPVVGLLTEEVVTRPFSPARLLLKTWRRLPMLGGTVGAELRRQIRDPALRAALAGATLYTGVAPDRAPVTQILGVVALLTGRLQMPEGGMGRIPAVLAEELRRQGGDIRLRAPVEALLHRNGRVHGLSIAGQGSMEFDAVVSTVSGMATTLALLPAGAAPRRLERKARTAPLSQRALSVQLGLRNRIDAAHHFMGRLPLLEAQHEALIGLAGANRWLSYTVPTVTLPALAPPGCSLIEAYPGIPQDRPVDLWDAASVEAIAEETIAALAAEHDLEIAVRRIRGPRDFRDRMHLHEAAIYGLSPAASPGAQFPHRTPVENLFLAGQTTWPGYGVGPAMLSGIFAAREVLDPKRAARA